VYGQEPNLEIMGAWLWRGVEIPAEIKDLDCFEYLTLTKVDLTNPASKQQWAEYWIN
jgi:elongation factor 1-gamma